MRKNFGVETWFSPLPVLVIGTYDKEEKDNVMTASWGGIYNRGLVVLSLDERNKTFSNIQLRQAFTMSFADEKHIKEVDYFGLVSGSKHNKIQTVGFHVEKSAFVDAPIILEFPFTLECELVKINEDGIIIGAIRNISVDETILGDDGKIDYTQFLPISYDPVHRVYRNTGDMVEKAFKAGSAYIGGLK